MHSTAADLAELTPHEFEQFIAELWAHGEDWQTTVSRKGRDGGVDVWGEHPRTGASTALQAKRIQPDATIGAPEVRQYGSLQLEHDDVDGVTIVTTGTFTQPAKRAAQEQSVQLVDGDDLHRLIDRYDAHSIAATYIGTTGRDGGGGVRLGNASNSSQSKQANREQSLTTSKVSVNHLLETLISAFVALIILYVMLSVIDILMFDIPFI